MIAENPVTIANDAPIIDPYEGFDYTQYPFDVTAFWDYFGGRTPTNNPDVIRAVHEFFPQDQVFTEDNKWWVYKKVEPINMPNKSWSW